MSANLFLVAAPRSGSTQLTAWLDSHPDITASSIKEPNFFSSHEYDSEFDRRTHLSDVNPQRYVESRSKKPHQFAIFREREQYDFLFERLNTRWRLDASTTYLHCPEAPKLISQYNASARVILLFREPVERAVSHYRLARRTGRTMRTFGEELEAELEGETPLPGRFLLRQSLYAESYQRFGDMFPPDRRFVVFFEELTRNPRTVVGQVCSWLDIDSDEIDFSVTERNSGVAPRFPEFNVWFQRSGLKTHARRVLPRAVKRKLADWYFDKNAKISVAAEDLVRLKSIVGEDKEHMTSIYPELRFLWAR